MSRKKDRTFLNLEKGPGFRSGVGDLWKFLSVAAIGNAIIAWFFWASKTIVMIEVGEQAGLEPGVIASWIFVLHLFNGVLALIMCLYYKQPFVIAGMIPLYGILINAIEYATYAEICGAFLIAGVCIVILGVTGATKKILTYLPMPVVMGMVAGALFKLTLPMFTTAADIPVVWAITIAAFFVVLMIPKLERNFPAALLAMIVGLIALTVTGQTSWNQMSVPAPSIMFQMPEFSIRAVLGMTVPILALFLGLNTIQAAGSLKLNGYKPPVTSMTVIPGIATIIGSFFCSFPCSPAGPTTAMLSGPASGKKLEGRYVAAFITSILQILFAVFIMALVSLTYCVPAAFISCVAALAMVDVTMSALRSAFGGGFKVGAVIAFLITMSGIVFLGISSAFWGLVGGILVAALVERKEFKAFIEQTKKESKREQTANEESVSA